MIHAGRAAPARCARAQNRRGKASAHFHRWRREGGAFQSGGHAVPGHARQLARRNHLVADVDVASIRGRRGSVIHFNPFDLSDDLVGRRIDQRNIVAAGIGLDDSDLPHRIDRQQAGDSSHGQQIHGDQRQPKAAFRPKQNTDLEKPHYRTQSSQSTDLEKPLGTAPEQRRHVPGAAGYRT